MRASVDTVPADPGIPRPPSIGSGLSYMPHVDGLRAISIVAVLGFHAHISGFGGGFVGVDIFFVISGFLIINQIVAALHAGRFSVFDFYARRALRILPTYLVVLVATLPFAMVLLRSPRDLEVYAVSGALSPLFLTNIYFLMKSGYFDIGANMKPLLHTWSLAVEEQFYLVVPLLMIGLFALSRRKGWRIGRVLAISAIAIAVLSFAFCVILTPPDLHPVVADRNPAFLLTPFRAWEFVAGGVLGAVTAGGWTRFWRGRLASEAAAGLAGLLGLALIVAAIGFWGLAALGVRSGDYDRVMGYPGHAAALPVIGAMLVILSGVVSPKSPVARLLSLGPVVYVGKISYALYLWHWPVLVFAHLLPVEAHPALVNWAAIVLSVALSVVTLYAIERPVLAWRRRSGLGRDERVARRIFYASIVICVGVGAVVGGIASIPYLKALDNPMIAKAFAAYVEPPGTCLEPDDETSANCFGGGKPLGVLVGDSHAYAIMPRVEYEAERAGDNLMAIAVPRCNPLYIFIDREGAEADPFCTQTIEKFDRYLPKLNDDTTFAIFAGRWNAMIPDHSKTPVAAQDEFRKSLIEFLEMFGNGGKRRILVIGPWPEFKKEDPFHCVDLAQALGLSVQSCGVPRADVEARRADTAPIMADVASEFPNVRYVDPIDLFCDDKLCLPMKDGALAYFDDNHLNAYGAKLLYDRFAPDFQWAFRGDRPAKAATR